jgi:protein-disulfide isomerase
MASRKEQKEQARAARLAQEHDAASKAQRTRRFQTFGGVIAIAAIVTVVAIVVSSGAGNASSGLKHGKAARSVYNSVNNEIGGIPQSGTTLGKPGAKVTLTYWGDLQCPICQEFTLGTSGGGLPEFIQKDVRTGIAKVHYESLCTATCNESGPTGGTRNFNIQQSASYSAGKQDLAWYYIELFYRQQGAEDSGYATRAFINGIAEQIPKLNFKAWEAGVGSNALVSQVNADQNEAASTFKIDATPSFAITGPKGTSSLGTGVLTYSQLAAAVKAVS